MNAENNCVLKLDHLVFDEIAFNRVNFRSENDLSVEFGFNFEERENGEFVASIRVIGTKEDEYTFVVRASGYFRLEDHVEDRKTIIQQNAVAIVFPYIRSQISLLTAQPEVEPVVLPAMNIAQMVEDAVKKGEEKSASCAN
nr:Preprotein translocase subunit SecB [uncultured Dysosmobacter sp.]